jgi:uncharacterized delta-60 repeat protein
MPKLPSIAVVVGLSLRILSAGPGDVDLSFDPGSGDNGTVYAVAAQADAKVLIGGDFTTVSHANRQGIARLNADGSADPAFDPGAGVNGSVRAIGVQPDGKVLVAGLFSTVDGLARIGLSRLIASGKVDGTFDPALAPGSQVFSIAVQADGKIVIAGLFTNIAGITRKNLLPG